MGKAPGMRIAHVLKWVRENLPATGAGSTCIKLRDELLQQIQRGAAG